MGQRTRTRWLYRTITGSAETQELFDGWRADLEHRLRAEEDDPVLLSHLAKYRSLLPSLALLFNLIDGVDAVSRQPSLAAVPRAPRVSVIWNPDNPATASEWKATQATARTLGIKLDSVKVRGAEDFVTALSKMSQRRPAAVVMINDTVTATYRQILADFAVKNRVPAITAPREFAEGGGLMSYGPKTSDLFRRAAGQVDKILKGAKPADLPVEQPTKFELVINLKTATALGLAIPQTLLLRADQVIE